MKLQDGSSIIINNNRKIREKFQEELLDIQDKRLFDAAAKEYKVPILQAALKRRPQREIYSDTIELARDRQDLEARKEERKREEISVVNTNNTCCSVCSSS
jgi:hypothetical protein